MTYTIVYTAQARRAIQNAYDWLFERTVQHAPEWHKRLVKSIHSLEIMPGRCPLAPENEGSDEEVRHLIVGDRIHAYRIIYTIRGEDVVIYNVVHGARIHY